MDNAPCKNCGKTISKQARNCPDCGHPQGLFAQLSGASLRDAVMYLIVYPSSAALSVGFIGLLADKPRELIIEVASGIGGLVFVLGGVALAFKAIVKPGR